MCIPLPYFLGVLVLERLSIDRRDRIVFSRLGASKLFNSSPDVSQHVFTESSAKRFSKLKLVDKRAKVSWSLS